MVNNPRFVEAIQAKIGTAVDTEDMEKQIAVLQAVSYTHLRAHETGRNLVCRLLLEKKKKKNETKYHSTKIIVAAI